MSEEELGIKKEFREVMLDGLIPIFFMLVMILVLPWIMDNPNILRHGIRESNGDLRDKWRSGGLFFCSLAQRNEDEG